MDTLDQQIGSLRAQQASAWVSALARPDHEQRQEFVAWLKESPLNVREFLLTYAIEQSLQQLDSQRRIDIDGLLAQFTPRITQLPIARPVPAEQPVTSRRWLYRVAASLAVISVIGWWALVGRQAGWQEFSTGTGEQRALQLEDGSVVHLNAHSRIALNFTATSRDIRLVEGEALFEVFHETRPFLVHTRDAIIRDIGTRFNVNSRADGIKVAVIEGSVEVTAMPENAPRARPALASTAANGPAATSHILIADQQAQINRHGVITVETAADTEAATAWWQRRLIYRKETLAHIAEDFNRYNRRRIELVGDAVMQRAYTGVFDADDLESLAQVLASDPELHVERLADNTIVVRAR